MDFFYKQIWKVILLPFIILFPLFVFATTLGEVDIPEQVTAGCEHIQDIKDYAQCMVEDEWDATQWDSFYNILEHESGWCHTKWNGQGVCPDKPRDDKLPGHSNAYGLCQTMLSVHGLLGDKGFMNNPYQQVDWCIAYAKRVYGTPNEAWRIWKIKKYW